MIAIFARSNHPHGFGYSSPRDYFNYTQPGIGAHGYSVVGVICRSRKQVAKVVEHIRDQGLDLPDSGQGRTIYPNGKPERPYSRAIGQSDVIRWYSGGPHDWDYLFTVPGNKVIWPWPQMAENGSRGDNRFAMVYNAKDVLNA